MRAELSIGAAILAAAAWTYAGPPGDADSLNLYEWMFRAPVVVSGRPLDASGRHTPVLVERVVRGETLEPGVVIPVRVGEANRERKDFESRLKLESGTAYLFLLEPVAPRKADGETTYALVRGVRGVREVPAEGAAAFLDAAERFARVQSHNLDSLAWEQFRGMLEDTDPLLVVTALDEHLKFRRGGPDLMPVLVPLLAHPRPDIREKSLRLAGRILAEHPADRIPDPRSVEMEIVALARRDPSVPVRVAATEALRGLADPGIDEIWEEISREDPEQEVRYAAERLLYERSVETPARPGNRGGREGGGAR